MSLHIWRKIYWVCGWEYPEKADEKQKRQKYLVTEQIKKSNLKLKPVEKTKDKDLSFIIELNKLKEPPVTPLSSPKYSKGQYLYIRKRTKKRRR
jgi:hypothetical protein